MLVHRLLDVVFRTLDAIDAVRARVDAVLGHDAQPPSTWPPEAPPAPPTSPTAPPTSPSAPSTAASSAPTPSDAPSGKRAARGVAARAPTSSPARKPPKATPAAADAASAKSRTPTKKASATATATTAKKTTAAKAQAKTKATTASGDSATHRDAGSVGRKGSVDRSGRDLESPRARAIETWLKEQRRPLVAVEAALDGKRTLARVLWAVACAEDAGSEQGLTAADTSALLSSAAGVEVFTTNVGRTFRDESALFVETIPDGRSKRYKLTPAGRARLTEIGTR